MLRKINTKSLSELISEWDALAPVRFKQISSGEDISYNRVITPRLLELIKPTTASRILDAGSGTGIFTSRLSALADEVIGVEPSPNSVKIARSLNDSRAHFIEDTIEHFASTQEPNFDVIVANMVLMDVLSLSTFLRSCRHLLSPEGRFAFSITHPCFWPEYYGYGHAEWFDYQKEIIVESPFRITSDQGGSLVSTHIHRPLSLYFAELRASGFVVEALKEPVPGDDIDLSYRKRWKAPRYLLGSCKVVNNLFSESQ